MKFKKPKTFSYEVVEIKYHTNHTSGYMIIEKDFYLLNGKKIDKCFKGVDIEYMAIRRMKEHELR